MTIDDGQIIDLPSERRPALEASVEASRRGSPAGRGRPAAAPSAEPMVICESLVKIYKVADLEVVALQGLDLGASHEPVLTCDSSLSFTNLSLSRFYCLL